MHIAEWRQALAPLGATLRDGAWRVTIDGVTLALEVSSSRDAQREHVDVRVTAPLSPTLAGLSMASAALALSDLERVKTGDASLDRLVFLFTSQATTLGGFDEDTRRSMIALLERGLSFGTGTLVLELPAALTLPNVQALTDLLTRAARLAAALVVPEGPEAYARLARIALNDADGKVRAAYAALGDRFRDVKEAIARAQAKRSKVASAETFDALVSLIRDAYSAPGVVSEAWTKLLRLFPIAEVRPLFREVSWNQVEMLIGKLVNAAQRRAGDELGGVAVALLELAEIKGGVLESSGAIGLALVLGRARHLPGIPWLGRALLREDSQEVVRAALNALFLMPLPPSQLAEQIPSDAVAVAQREAPAAVDSEALRDVPSVRAMFDWLFERVQTARLRVPIARYLEAYAATGSAAFAPLVADFIQSESESVQNTAIAALGEIGNGEHIKLLAPLTKGLFRSGLTKDAAVAAIARIRERAPDAVAGALALSEGDGGGLALAADHGDDGDGGGDGDR